MHASPRLQRQGSHRSLSAARTPRFVGSHFGGEPAKEPVKFSTLLTRGVCEPVALTDSEILTIRRKIELCHTSGQSAVAAYQLQAKLDDDALLPELEGLDAPSEIENLVYVPRPGDVKRPDDVATRKPCANFQKFEPLLQQIQQGLKADIRKARPFELKSEIEPDRYFIVNGQIAYATEEGKVFTNHQGRRGARLRVIFDNGT